MYIITTINYVYYIFYGINKGKLWNRLIDFWRFIKNGSRSTEYSFFWQSGYGALPDTGKAFFYAVLRQCFVYGGR